MKYLIKIHIFDIYHHKYELCFPSRSLVPKVSPKFNNSENCFARAFKARIYEKHFFPRQNTHSMFLLQHAYFYIYDNHKNLHNLNSQMLSSMKHLFQQIYRKAAYVGVLHTTTGNSIKFYTFSYTHILRKKEFRDFFSVRVPFNKVHNVNEFDLLYMQKNC